MQSRLRYGVSLCIIFVTLIFAQVEYGYGSYFIEYIYDNAGNLIERRMVYDATPPTTTASPPEGSYNTPQSVSLLCSDPGGSGCDKIYYTTDGSIPTTSSPVYSSPINITVATTLKFFAEDRAHNSESVKTQIYTFDMTPPTGTITINGGATYTNSINVTLTLTCNDDLTGCSQMQFSNDNVTYFNPEAYVTTKAWTLTGGSGTKSVYVKFRDAAGNWSNPYSDTIIFNSSCSNSTVRIGSTSYTSLQSAYNAASNGNVIKVQGVMLIENLTVNRNISVTLEGGYDCGFTTNYGNMTAIKG